MGLLSDMFADGYAGDDEIVFDEAAGTWTVVGFPLYDNERILGVPSKELALAIARALDAAYRRGGAEL